MVTQSPVIDGEPCRTAFGFFHVSSGTVFEVVIANCKLPWATTMHGTKNTKSAALAFGVMSGSVATGGEESRAAGLKG